MKTKNIKLIMMALFAGFVSCSEETILEKQLPTGETANLEIVVTPSEVMTKAGTVASGYTWATDEELRINTCILAVFKKEADKSWKKVSITSHAMTDDNKTTVSGNEDKRLAYKIASVTLSVDTTYHIQVIANPSDASLYTSCSSLADFETIQEGNAFKYAFEAGNLVKVGKKIVGKDAEENDKLTLTSTRIVVPLKQLAARVDLNIQVKLGEKTWVSSKYEKEDGSPLGGTMTATELQATYPKVEEVDAGIKSADLYYMDRRVVFDKSNNGISGSQHKGFKIPGYTAVRVDEYDSWTIDLTKLTILNVRTQATAVLPMKDSNLSLKDYPFPSLDKPITFYTYGREFGAYNPLQVSLIGTVYKANVEEKTKVTCDWYAYNNKGTGQGPKNDLSTPTGEDVIVDGGWGKEVIVFFVEDRSKNWEEIPGENVVVNRTKKEIGPYDRVFSIEPTIADGAKTDGILDGNQYSISATITKMNVNPSLNYEVIPWSDNKHIDIPFN